MRRLDVDSCRVRHLQRRALARASASVGRSRTAWPSRVRVTSRGRRGSRCDWQPWGRDAFALAGQARPARPARTSGSDACHWCDETDRAIYTDPEIGCPHQRAASFRFASIAMNGPTWRRRYQTAVGRLAGLRGWPLTVFLTGDGSPFFGGTYFPADDPVTGRGLKQLLPEIAKRYRDERPSIVQQAACMRQLMLTGGGEAPGLLRASLLRDGIAMGRARSRRRRGGGDDGKQRHACRSRVAAAHRVRPLSGHQRPRRRARRRSISC